MKKKFILLTLMLMCLCSFSLSFVLSNSSESNSKLVTSSDIRKQITLPILMYHSISDSSQNEYTISTDTFESDLKWLKEKGFTAVSAKQIIDYVENGTVLPQNPVLITFDDGYANNYTLAYPLLEKYNMKAVISIIGSESDLSSGDIYRDLFNSNLSWGEIAIMASSGIIEIGNHTYSLHSNYNGRKGADMKEGESIEEYRSVLLTDLSKNQAKISAAIIASPLIFAWPYGAYPADGCADDILKELGFKMTLTSYQKTNIIEQGNPDSLFGLKRFLRSPDFDMDTII